MMAQTLKDTTLDPKKRQLVKVVDPRRARDRPHDHRADGQGHAGALPFIMERAAEAEALDV